MYETKVALDNDSIKFSVPLMKVDRERRIVYGFATLDNIDKQDDVVTREASVNAFTMFRGNIREQHDPKKAVGRVVDFKEDSLFDEETGKAYSGVFVSAYVSKGAEDTWQKVLDGTLSGFSIGGAIKETDKAYSEELGKSIRVISGYDLLELSLVDNPANQLANVVHIEKIDGSMVMETPLVKGGLQNIFWCDADGIVFLKSDESQDCAMCNNKMQVVGFVESSDREESKENTIKASVAEFKKNLIVKEATSMEEKVEDQIEKSEEVLEELSEATEEVMEEVAKSEDSAVDSEEAIEKSEEEEVQEEPVEKAQTEEVLSPLIEGMSKLADAILALDSKIEDMSKSIGSIKSDVSEVKSDHDKFGKRVEAVEETTAFKKSGDLGEVVQEKVLRKQAPLWGGRFLNSADL